MSYLYILASAASGASAASVVSAVQLVELVLCSGQLYHLSAVTIVLGDPGLSINQCSRNAAFTAHSIEVH